MRNQFATLVVEPNVLIREGLVRVLDATQFRVVASASCVEDLGLASFPQRRSILLMLVGTGENPRAAVTQIELFRNRYPAGRIAVLADRWNLSEMVSVFRAGANACFAQFGTCDILIKSLELVMLGEMILPATMLLPLIFDNNDTPIEPQHDANAPKFTRTNGDDTPRLSIREKCVLRYLVEGDSNKVIARRIEVTEATVKVHIKAILRKIRVQNRTQAAIWAINHGSLISSIAEFNAATRRPPSDRRDSVSFAKHRLLTHRPTSATHLAPVPTRPEDRSNGP
jgi:two-component system nitrate/nitrite response regulator NarL